MSSFLFRPSAVLLAATCLSTAALAQNLPAQQPDAQANADGSDATETETIIVTGSRIARPDLDAPSPVQVIGAPQIAQSGATNIQELLLENPAIGTPALSRTNSAFLTSGTGVATVDLRDLGSDRTLVLINGRRVVAGLPGTATVDLNVIPTQFLERVDILTGGASSIYGSDAVAGVVNFIYKENFEGILVNGQYGLTSRGDDPRYQASVTLGDNLGDRGNFMVHVGYSKEEGLKSSERSNTRLDDIDEFAQFTGDPADFGNSISPFLSGFAPQGRFTAGSYLDANGVPRARNFTYDAGGNLIPCFSANGGVCATDPSNPLNGTQIGPNGFNRQAFRTIAVPVERYLFAARGKYEVVDGVSAVVEGTYANTSSSREIEPFGLGSEDIYPATGGLVPIETLVNGVAVLNPLVPGAIAAAAEDEDGDGLRDISFARRLNEFGSRSGSTSRDFFRFVVGLEGEFGADDRFRWDLSYVYGRTSESQRSTGQVNVLNFANALSAVPDVDDVNNNGSTTDVVCASANARAQGCVPINIFGAGSISQEAVQYVQAPQSFDTLIQQSVVNGNISGDIVELPAGPLALAIGFEHRRERSRETNDALTNAGLNAGNAIPDTEGRFDVTELYGEVRIPILSERPFFHELSVQASGRISDYSTVGNVSSYAGGVEWAPIPDIRLRGTYARAVRAPNIGELFTGPSQTFPSGLQDPCTGVGPTGGGALGDACRAAPGVAANIAANGVFTLNQGDVQGISGFNSGNPDLNEETSESWTAGAVIQPRSIEWLSRFTLTVDYFNISIKDAIVAPPRQFILDQCYNGGDQSFCQLITRRAGPTATNSAGSLEFIDAPLVNGGRLKVEGLDVNAAFRQPVGWGEDGSILARVAYTHYFDGYVIPVPGADKDPFVGEIGSAADRFTANLGYSSRAFDLVFTGTYIGKSSEDDQFLAAYDLEPGDISVPAQFYLDMQVAYRTGDTFEFYAGVDNLLDNTAPNILSGTTFNTTGTDTAADVYDPFGRRFYVGARLSF